jgi:glycosyltransferase involved in cell wall biosynthesis
MHTHSPSLPVSVVLITLNEADRLPRCLASLPSGVEIIVLDSESRDGTVACAEKYGARVAQRVFDTYSAQRNAAIAMASREWVFSLDADEELSPELAQQLQQLSALPISVSGLTVPRALVFMGRTMRFGRTVDHPLRIFRRTQGQFVGAIHETVSLASGAIQSARGRLLHHSYRDLTDYLARLNRYTSLIAEQKSESVSWLHVIRPWTEFVTRYVFKLGFLDGYPGYAYAWLSSLYAYMKYAKRWEKTHVPLASASKEGS